MEEYLLYEIFENIFKFDIKKFGIIKLLNIRYYSLN